MQISSSAESGTAEELGILNFEFLLRQAAKPSGELFSASPAIVNYSVVNYSRQGKLRRLWRLAVATQPPIADANQRRVPRGHVSIRNPLQAPKERSCGISITSPSPGSAKRDRLSSSISDRMCKSPFGELILGGAYLPTAALLRSLQWVS